MELALIYARAANGVIGKDNTIPWRLPEDMARLKALTMGCPVIMGRKTWDSLPPKFRPLPGRRNIVVTRQAQWQGEGAERVGSVEEAVARCAGAEKAWIIGGAEVYRIAEPLAQMAEVTEIEQAIDGDTFAPQLGGAWREVARERHVAANGLPYAFVTYRKDDAQGQRGG